MPATQYKVLTFDQDSLRDDGGAEATKALTDDGLNGWELVEAMPAPNGTIVFVMKQARRAGRSGFIY